jgi:hypothetical protein
MPIRDRHSQSHFTTPKGRGFLLRTKTWLQKNNLITIVKVGEVLPYFPKIFCHH